MSIHSLTFFLDNSKILFGCLRAICIALLECGSLKILWKDLFLKDLSYSKFSSSFDLEPFELFDLSIEIKDHVSLL